MTTNQRPNVASSEPTTSVVPHRTMKHLVLDIQKKFEATVAAHNTFLARRIELGRDLLEARARVEAGEEGDIAFWDWYQQKFTRSRRDAERVMEIASQENPVAAHEAYKAKDAAAHRVAYHQKQITAATEALSQDEERRPAAARKCKAKAELLPPDPTQEEIIDQIIDLFKRLSRQAQVRCGIRLRKIIAGDA